MNFPHNHFNGFNIIMRNRDKTDGSFLATTRKNFTIKTTP